MDRIAGGANTASKAFHRFPANYPKLALKAKGAYFFDERGNQFLDFLCSLGSITLGYRNEIVDLAVIKTIQEKGPIFSLSTQEERVLADLIAEIIPSCEMSRFFSNGKDPTTAAVRLARHITGNELILSNSYHGAADGFMCVTEVDKGVPQDLKKTITTFEYGDEKRIKEVFDKYKVAAIIMEPSTTVVPDAWFLPFVRDICTLNGTLLIFDEIVTFPRYPKMSAQEYYGITPDLTCIGKGAANGYAWSSLSGREKYMKHLCDNEVFASTTHGGNLVGVSAAIATLTHFKEKDAAHKLNKLGETFKKKIKKNKIFSVDGPVNSRLFFKFKNPDDRWKLYQEAIKAGIFFSIPILFNASMSTTDINWATDEINKIIDRFDSVELIGRNPSEVFVRYKK